jgi:hypothetical protein
VLQGVLQGSIDVYGRLRPLWTCWTVSALGILGLGLRAGSLLGDHFDCSRDGFGLLGIGFRSRGVDFGWSTFVEELALFSGGPFMGLGVVLELSMVLY